MNSLKKLTIPLILFVFIFFTLFFYIFNYYSKNLPNIEEIIKYKPKTITKIYDSNEILYGLFFDEKREYGQMQILSTNIITSTKDDDFWMR